ncbi:hypothetical protein Tco_1314927 [Tanacetum coccineum]
MHHYKFGIRLFQNLISSIHQIKVLSLDFKAPFGGVTDWYQEARLIKGEREDVHNSSYLVRHDPTTIPSVAPTTDLPVIHDDSPLIPTDTPTISPTIPPIAPTIQYTSSFVCTDSSDSDTPDTPPSQDPYEVTVARWRSRLIHVGRPYRTQPNRFTSDDSSRDSPSETSLDYHSDTSSYSSSRHSSSGYAMLDSLYDSPTTTSAGPSRKRFRSLTLSVLVVSPIDGALSPVHAYLLLPRKRIRDYDSVTNFEVSSEDSYVSYVPRDVDIDACIVFMDDLRDRGMDVRVVVKTAAEEEVKPSVRGTVDVEVDLRVGPVIDDDARESVREDVPDHVTVDEAVEVTYETLRGLVQRFHNHTMKIPAHRIQVIECVQRDLGHRIVATSQQSATITMPNATRTGMTQDAINELISKRVEEALKAYDAAKNPRTETEIENEQQDDNVDANGDNGNGNGNENGNPNANNRGVVPVAQECTYQDFVKCQPLNFKRTKGVVGLTRWFEKMEMVFHIINCPPRYQVKYATCTLLDGALTW